MISMKINNLKNIALGLLLAPLAFVGCVEEQTDPAATAVATSEPEVTFAAKEAPEQVIQVYADGEWAADYEAEWVSISPMSGNGLTDVTIIVDDNLASDGTVAAPREAKVIFRGKYTERQAELTIYQKGDNFRDAKELSIAEASKLEDKKTTKLPDVQIVATSADGVLVKDATGHMYVAYNGDCKIGDKVYVAGEKTTVNGLPAIKDAEVTVNSNAEFTYPTAANLLENLDPSKANDYLYVTVEAGLLGSVLQFETSLPVSVNLLSPKAGNGIDLEAVNMHNVKVDGYFVGLNGTTVNLIVTKIEDKGMNEDLRAYFYDDFSWMKPFLDEYNKNATPVGDAVGTDNSSAEAPNLRTAGGLAGLLDEFLARGYEDLNKEAKVIYPQSYYWKFGKTSNHGGIMLPKMELEGSTLINAVLSFSWSPHMTGSGNIDKVSVVAELEGAGFFDNGTNVSDPFVHELQKGDLNWHNVSILLKGVNNSTRIKIRPLNFTAADPDQQRWHLDNVKVAPSDIPYKDPVYAEVSLSDEIITFEGTPTAPVEFKVKSNKDWTLTKGIESDWFELDVTEGLADEEVTVKVTAQPSTSITLRKSTILLASADTRKTIHVVQSAAGGELEPLISIVGGNKGNVGYEAGQINVGVQANVAYQYTSDASWVTLEAVPATRGIVETSEFVVKYEANASEQPRTATIRVFNADENLEVFYTLTQAGYESGVYFQDNFDWISSFAVASGAGDSMGNDKDDNAKNAYTAVEGFADALAAQGYEDLLPGTNTIYLQTNYLKFSKTSNTNGIKLPAIAYGEATDAILSFDWGVHVGGGGADAVEIVVELEGNGTVNAVPAAHTAGNWEWQTQKYYLSGVDNNTRIIIKPSAYTGVVDATKTYFRWYLDNIKVSKPKPTVLAAWDLSSNGMSTYTNTWGGLDPGTYDKSAGDGGKFVAANAGGSGKLTYVQIDKNEIDVNSKARRVTGATGEPYVEGQWVGDSWNLTADAHIPAGSLVAASFASRASGTGLKYWIVEYLDGETWKPALPTKTVEVGGQTITYNVEHMNTTEFKIAFAVSTTVDMTKFQIRETCLSNAQAKNGELLDAPNGGTMRIKGADLSPKIVMY